MAAPGSAMEAQTPAPDGCRMVARNPASLREERSSRIPFPLPRYQGRSFGLERVAVHDLAGTGESSTAPIFSTR